jgi:hypothetical protein
MRVLYKIELKAGARQGAVRKPFQEAVLQSVCVKRADFAPKLIGEGGSLGLPTGKSKPHGQHK